MADLTRRQFITSGSATAAALGMLGSGAPPAHDMDVADGPPTRPNIEAEMRQRAAYQVKQARLIADYYRIRRQLAYPLPLEELIIPDIEAPSIPDYPWSVWLLWALEERVLSLGWAAEWFGDAEARAAVTRDLEALCGWPAYRQLDHPDLGSAHAAHILWTAYTKWSWPGDALRAKIGAACERHANDLVERVRAYYGELTSKEKFLALDAPHEKLHNIPHIGAMGAALTASVVSHPACDEIHAYLHGLFGAVLELRDRGYTEGVAYDGYVLAFVCDWLLTLPETARKPILDHPGLRDYLEEAYMLGCPGHPEMLAELSDVEPKQMPWHHTAQAKLQTFKPDAVRAWHLSRLTVGWQRADALAALHALNEEPAPKVPETGGLDANYAVVLRTGWAHDDLAVAVSCTNSPMDHLQADNGTIMIGTRGRWFISDPGYQQYMKGDERTFTLGETAHNAPVINGHAQTAKAPKRLALDATETAIDLTACYPGEAGATSVVRTVSLGADKTVRVTDRIEGANIARIAYHWHGHPEAAWWVDEEGALIHLPEGALRFTCRQADLSLAQVMRLPGSRGQLTLVCAIEPRAEITWRFHL
ncbi:MAG: heparinase II/III family protein [Candidatus Hydrogenedentota bacterium]